MTTILSTGHQLPETVWTNDDLATMVDTSDEWIRTRTGIERRHIAKDESALDLAEQAARQALAQAGVAAEELGLIVCACFTAESATPSLSCALLRALDAKCPAFDLNAACSGFLYALGAAKALIADLQLDQPVLVLGVELLSRITNWADRSTCVLFGDGAGAAVLKRDDPAGHEILYNHIMAYADKKHVLEVPGINHQGPDVQLAPSLLAMNGPEVYKFATRTMVKDIRAALAKLGLNAADIRYYVPHQANIRIIQSAASLLKVSEERFFVNIQEVGNTSCASVAIALDELARSGKLQKGDLVLLSAFGGGLTSAVSVIRW